MSWDAICVGAGLTSLAFAALYQQCQPGRRVLLLDKHALAGGYATEFRRPKASALFDCSLHKLSGMASAGNLRRILDRLDLIEDLELVYHKELFAAVRPERDLALPIDPGRFLKELVQAFPHERVGIERFMTDVSVHGRNAYFQFQIAAGEYEPDFPTMRYAHRFLRRKTVEEALSEYIADPRLKEVLCAPTIYVGGFPERLGYLYYLHIVYANLYQGTAYVVGSSQRLSNLLANRIRSGGGEILLKKPVRRVLVPDGRVATGVETAGGECFYSDNIVINVSPHFALSNLFEGVPKLERVRAQLERLQPSLSTTTLYLVLDCPPADLGFGVPETIIFSEDHTASVELRCMAQSSPEDAALQEGAYWQASPMEVTNYHAVDPERNQVLVANVLDTACHWPNRNSPTEYPAYKMKKQRATKVLMARMLAVRPQLKHHVLYQEMATPRTYERFTNNTAGAGYGAAVGVDVSGHSFHYGFPIRGVHFMSAWTAGPGYEAAMGYAEARANTWVSL